MEIVSVSDCLHQITWGNSRLTYLYYQTNANLLQEDCDRPPVLWQYLHFVSWNRLLFYICTLLIKILVKIQKTGNHSHPSVPSYLSIFHANLLSPFLKNLYLDLIPVPYRTEDSLSLLAVCYFSRTFNRGLRTQLPVQTGKKKRIIGNKFQIKLTKSQDIEFSKK